MITFSPYVVLSVEQLDSISNHAMPNSKGRKVSLQPLAEPWPNNKVGVPIR